MELIETSYYINLNTQKEISIITTYTDFDYDVENDELHSAYNGSMEFIGIDEADYDPLEWENIDVEYELK